ncbi:MAG: AmmeMemoRadiSam system protein B [Acidobacteriota bacterium]
MNLFAVLTGVTLMVTTAHAEVRRPAVAGSFYPDRKERLEAEVAEYLEAAPAAPAPVAVIVPHAGYVFSGPTAGKAFGPLAGSRASRVILLGPSHHAGYSGGALPDPQVTAFATPMGHVPIDVDAVAALREFAEFRGPGRAHGPEHCLEVELPFLQAALGPVPIVPILVGHDTDRRVALAMARRLSALLGPGTVIAVSSDFTHHGAAYGYNPFGSDRALATTLLDLGRDTAGRAAAIDGRGFWHQVEASGDTVCGARPIEVLLELLAHAFRGEGRVVEVTTSGHVSGNWSQVVTYAAVAYSGEWTAWRDDGGRSEPVPLDRDAQRAVLELARATLRTHLTHDGSLARWFASHPVGGPLAADAGVFVTVHNTGPKAVTDGRLRGCIGVIEAREPLVDAVVHAAVSAAHDPRFRALDARELDNVALEVSVLSPMREVSGPEEIEMGRHGVLLSRGGRQAVFLPQVATETGWTRDVFLSQLARKAGLAADAWRHGATFEVFTAQVFSEEE